MKCSSFLRYFVGCQIHKGDPPSYTLWIIPDYYSNLYIFSSIDNVHHNFPTTTGVVIGFKEPEVQVPENIINGVKLLCLEVLEGNLMRTTVVSVSYQDKSAISEYTTDEIL